PDHRHSGLLRMRGERPRYRHAAEQRDELAPPHVEHGASSPPALRRDNVFKCFPTLGMMRTTRACHRRCHFSVNQLTHPWEARRSEMRWLGAMGALHASTTSDYPAQARLMCYGTMLRVLPLRRSGKEEPAVSVDGNADAEAPGVCQLQMALHHWRSPHRRWRAAIQGPHVCLAHGRREVLSRRIAQ